MTDYAERLAERFDFLSGIKLKGEELDAYIAGLPPRAKVLFSQFEAPNIVKRIRKAASKKS